MQFSPAQIERVAKAFCRVNGVDPDEKYLSEWAPEDYEFHSRWEQYVIDARDWLEVAMFLIQEHPAPSAPYPQALSVWPPSQDQRNPCHPEARPLSSESQWPASVTRTQLGIVERVMAQWPEGR